MANSGTRIDKYLASLNNEELYSRNFIDKLIKKNLVTINNRSIKKSECIHGGETIEIQIPLSPQKNIKAEKIALDIIYEDKYLAIINKPSGMVVHPAPGNYTGTLVNGLLYHYDNLPNPSEKINIRPGIVHRLDKDTSGLLIIAKTERALSLLTDMFKNREIDKIYLALTMNNFTTKEDTIKTFYGRNLHNRQKMAVRKEGKIAITHYQIIKSFPGFDLTKIHLETGRTHQIRVHFSYIHHPIMADSVYSTKKQTINSMPFTLQNKMNFILANTLFRQALHAHQLEFTHPITKKIIKVTSDLPEDMIKVMRIFKDDIIE